MLRDFDLYLVSVDWDSENNISIFTPSALPLEPSEIDEKTYHYDMVIYNKIDSDYYQLAIKSKIRPKLDFVENTFDNSLFLIPGTEYWILKGEWSTSASKRKYHHCPSINTVGRLTFTIKDLRIEVDLNPNIEGFDFNALKNDFEGELWYLITSNNSQARVKKPEMSFGGMNFFFSSSQAIIAFITEFEKILKKPKCELKYNASISTLARVKPIPATYKKMAVSGVDVLLPSKSFLENYDIYENRYLCYMLSTIIQVAQYNYRFLTRHVERLNNDIDSIDNNIFDLKMPQKVNKEMVTAEMHAQEMKIASMESMWKSRCQNLTYEPSGVYVWKTIELFGKYFNSENTYWGRSPNLCLITFPIALSKYLKTSSKIKVELNTSSTKTGTSRQGNIYQIYEEIDVKSIETFDVQIERNILERQRQKVEHLELNNWMLAATLNPSELDKVKRERKNQIETLQRGKISIEKKLEVLKEIKNELEQIIPILLKLQNSDFVKEINNRNLVRLQPSMTFIQNTQYRNALKQYKEFLKTEGLELNVLDYYEKIAIYGIREMPQVYELWTLISIISVLENTFSYKHVPSDLINLLNIISPQNKKIETSVEISFTGELNERKIVLYYQRKLANGKRPDILLEISCRSRKIFIVLDAKFKNYNYKISAVDEARKMINKYRINSEYYVFILHPCKDLTNNKKTTKLTNFGGERIFVNGGQVEHPFHNFGYLMIKPNETDNLKKVIGMSLEYLLEGDHNSKKENGNIDPFPQYNLICIICGGTKTTTTKFSRSSNRHHYTCKCENKYCGHEIHIDYCWNCKTNLFKHGSYWDYHRTSVWSIFDIHCPKCGLTIADNPNIKH